MSSLPLPLEDVGQGPAVLLLHAGIADRRMWRGQLPALAATGFRVLAPDLRGFGDAPAPSGPFSHVDDLLALLDGLAIPRVSVAGDSMGGEAALALALTAPERVERLVLVSTLAGMTMDDEPSAALQRAWTDSGEAFERGDLAGATEVEVAGWLIGPGRSTAELDPDYLALGRQMIARTWERVASGTGAEEPVEPETPFAKRLAEVRGPTLLIEGDHDMPDVRLSMDRLAAGIPHATRAVIAHCAHLPPLEHPDEFNKLLIGFLRPANANSSGPSL